jgi:hypothetical protein
MEIITGLYASIVKFADAETRSILYVDHCTYIAVRKNRLFGDSPSGELLFN